MGGERPGLTCGGATRIRAQQHTATERTLHVDASTSPFEEHAGGLASSSKVAHSRRLEVNDIDLAVVPA
jgi:hypothetical protein